MNRTTEVITAAVPPEEAERRVAEYRRMGFERSVMPHSVYEDLWILCPWPGCDYRITAIDFHIEKMGDPQLYSRVIPAFWQGPGVVAKCPGCHQYVLFAMKEKKCISDPSAGNYVILPEDWHQYAYIVH
jgi:hypothetical protein